MTEQNVPMGGTAVAEPPAPVLPMDADDTADGGNRRKLLLVGAALGVLVLAVAAFFLTKSGGDSSNSGFPVPHAKVPAAVAKHHHAKAAANKPVTLPKKFKGHIGRDPFDPLYVAPVAAPTTTGSTGTTTNPDGTTTTTTNPDGTTTTPTTTHVRAYRPIWLQLRSVSPRSAKFTVCYSNGKTLRAVRFMV